MTLLPTPEQEVMQLKRQLEGEREWSASIDKQNIELLSEAKELHDIKRYLTDLKAQNKGGNLYVDGEVFNIEYWGSVDGLA